MKATAKSIKTKVADNRAKSKLRSASVPKVAAVAKASTRTTAAKTKDPVKPPSKSAKTAKKVAVAKKAVTKTAKTAAKKVVIKKTDLAKAAAKRGVPATKAGSAKVKEIRTKASARVQAAAPAKPAPKPAKRVQPDRTAAKPGGTAVRAKHKVAMPIPVAPPEPPRRPLTSGALRAFEHGVRIFNRRRFEEAKLLFENMLAKFPAEAELIARSQMYIQVCTQKLAQAKTMPHNADELYDHGVYALNIGDFSQAKTFFEKALRLRPDEAHLLYSLAATHAQTGAMDQALDYLKRTLQVQPRYRFQALNDSDFSGLRENKQFLELIGLASPFDLLQSRR